MVKGLPIFTEKNPTCESCIPGKHKRTSFPQSSTQSKQHLDLVHTDLCGPMPTKSIDGSVYFLTFIDDFSRKIWFYFLRHKSETFAKFKEFNVEDEKQRQIYQINQVGWRRRICKFLQITRHYHVNNNQVYSTTEWSG